MKFSFELSRSAAATQPNTGRALRQPLQASDVPGGVMTPDIMRGRRLAEQVEESRRRMQRVEEDYNHVHRSYDAALTNNYNADFRPTYGDANSEVLTGSYPVRARTRTLGKDTPHGKAIRRTFQNNVIGHKFFELEMKVGKWQTKTNDDGTTQQVFIEETETNRMIEEWWRKACRPENFTVKKDMSAMEAGRMVEAELVDVGDLIGLMHRDFDGNDDGFAIEFLEGDRLQKEYMGRSPMNGKFGGGNPIRFSIERHPKWGYALAYWILTRHPGNVLNPESGLGGTAPQIWRKQFDAKDVIHINNLRDRAEQDIGFTELDSTVQPLWRIHQYEKSLTLCAIASCQRPFVIEKQIPTGLQMPTEVADDFRNGFPGGGPGAPENGGGKNPAETQQGNGTPVQRSGPASERFLNWGEVAKILAPEFPEEAAHNFRLDNLRDIAVGAGTSYQHVSGDFQNLGFIAGLMCMVPFQDHCMVRQEQHKDQWVLRLFGERLRSAIMKGNIDLPMNRLPEVMMGAHFKGRRWPFVNPLVQAQAIIIMVEAGMITRQQAQDMMPNGMSFEKLVQELANEKALLEQHGLDYDQIDVTRPTVGKGAPGEQGTPAPGAQAPAKNRPANPVRSLHDGHGDPLPARDRIPIEKIVDMSLNGEGH